MIAYFSMEIAVEGGIPTYSGGLGILAGDTIRSAADLRIPMVAVTLLHRKGYFFQRLGENGEQIEEPVEWSVDDFLEELPERVSVNVEGRSVLVRSWKYDVVGVGGFRVPVYFLDSDLPENSDWDRTLTHFLYGGDERYRLCQEVILGIGGVRMLRALGYRDIKRFHMNEGHSSLLVLELMDEEARRNKRSFILRRDAEVVREMCVFTTHTPVPAGHDKFPLELVKQVLGRQDIFGMEDIFFYEGLFNMTYIALRLSKYVNGVARRHSEVSKLLFDGYEIDAITNGVHATTWVSEPFSRLYDKYIPGWRLDNFNLRYAVSIPKDEIWQAHLEAKKHLIEYVNRETNAGLDLDVLTVGFARRATAYKRGDLIFTDIARLRSIHHNTGKLQFIFAGKAHPRDAGGKEIIRRIFQARNQLREEIKIVYLENYDMELAKTIIPGVDVWLNTPKPPLEASGTSGMKAALNGVPSLSILDGWWIEGHIEGITGWSIGCDSKGNSDSLSDAKELYNKLEKTVIPLFYNDRERFVDVMRYAIAINGSFFNTQRMIQQYILRAYFD